MGAPESNNSLGARCCSPAPQPQPFPDQAPGRGRVRICCLCGSPPFQCLPSLPARAGQRETGSLVLPPNFASADFIRMRPLILLAALLWLRGFLAEVRWARGGAEWVGLFSGACLGFPPLCGLRSWSSLWKRETTPFPPRPARKPGGQIVSAFQAAGYCLLARQRFTSRKCLFSSVWQSETDSSLWSGASLRALSQWPVLQRPLHICFPPHSSPPYRTAHAHPWKGAQTDRVEVGVFRERERALDVGSGRVTGLISPLDSACPWSLDLSSFS